MLRLDVQNTFLHVNDLNIEAQRLSHSKSDPSLSTSRSGGDLGDAAPYDKKQTLAQVAGTDHIVFSSSDASRECSGSSRAEGAIPEVAALTTPVLRASDISDAAAPSEEEAPGAPARTCWSMGAELHTLGKCRPCAWHWQPEGCKNARSCKYCHMCDGEALVAAAKLRKKTKRQVNAIARRQETRDEPVDKNTRMPGRNADSLAASSQQWGKHTPIPRNQTFSL